MRWIAVISLLCGGCAVDRYTVAVQPEPITVSITMELSK